MGLTGRRGLADNPQSVPAVEILDVADLEMFDEPVNRLKTTSSSQTLPWTRLMSSSGLPERMILPHSSDDGLGDVFHVRYDVGGDDDRSVSG